MRLHDYTASGNCYKVRLLLALLGTPYERVPNAILWFLAEGTPFLPALALERARVVQWLSFEQERIMLGVGSTRFRRMTGRAELDPRADAARFANGKKALELLDEHLAGRRFVAADEPTIADISLFGYTHVAGDAGFDVADYPAVGEWLQRIMRLPGYMSDLVPYPDNALPGRGRSIYG